PAPQRRADAPVGRHVAEGIDPLRGGLEAREAEAPGLGDVDGADRGRLRRDVAPHAEALENAPAGVAERGGALIEARLRGGAERHALDEQQRAAAARERRGEARAHHAAADHRDIDLERGSRGHAQARAMSASIWSGSLGARAVSTSAPRLVTATSSSMRTPILRKRFGTPRAPAGR